MKYLKKYESIYDTKNWIEDVISNCKDLMLDTYDIFYNSEVTKKYDSWSNLKGELNIVTIECKFVAGPFNKSTKNKIIDNMEIIMDVHDNLISYMNEEGFKTNHLTIGIISTFFNVINDNFTYNISFSKELDSEFIAHLRYLKKYNLLNT
jgi:hypothetical protein